MRALALALAVTLGLGLAGCGTLPEPFYGDPGVQGAKLATPPAPVLMVPAPATALLDDASAKLYASDVAGQLADYDVPSVAGPVAKGFWTLRITATLNRDAVVPAYAVLGPDGKVYGTQAGGPVPAAAWANGDASTLAAAAAADAPSLTKTLALINARIQQSNPNSLENRAPRIFVGQVAGAPGDGDTALPMNLGRDLPGPDDEVVRDARRADFLVTGSITATPYQNGQIMVEMDWTVRDTNHRKIGQVTQFHPLSPSDIEPYWGDVAAAAAAEAASGIQQVVQNEVLKKAK